jgi:cell division protein FtsB
MIQKISFVAKYFSSKYFLAGLAFTLWILFFDHNNFFRYLEYRNELKDMKQKKAYYQDQIEKTRNDVELLKTNPFWLEKIAREQYLMKKNGEDIYIAKEE